MRLAFALGALLAASSFGPSAALADPLRVYAAGSLSGVMGELVAASGLSAASVAAPVFGPAGLLRQRIEGGEPADLFASADLAQPERIAAGRPGVSVVPFARNRLCAIGAGSLGLTASTLLGRMLDPAIRIATSTPGADPGGDYAQAVFARAETLHRGAQAVLQAKAQALFGGPASMAPIDGHSPAGAVLLGNRADLVLYYCSSAAAVVREVPGTVSVPLPPALEPGPVYGLAVLPGNPDAARLALFMLSGDGQAILARAGLLPVLSSTDGITVLGAASPPGRLALAELRALPAATVPLNAEHGATTQLAGAAALVRCCSGPAWWSRTSTSGFGKWSRSPARTATP